jgi:hypothetical protein
MRTHRIIGHGHFHHMTSQSADEPLAGRLAGALVQRLDALRVPYGREDSFKMAKGRLIPDRLLIGVDASSFAPGAYLDVAFGLGMPAECRPVLEASLPQANAVFFGLEEGTGGSVCKVYLEFWDHVRRQVRETGARTPLLLHLGVKWDSARPGRHEVAHYTCYPLLGTRDVLRRMRAVYPAQNASGTLEPALRMVRQGVKHDPGASFLYLEVGESGNPRRSFDVNFYKTRLKVSDVAPELRDAALHLGIAPETIAPEIDRLGPRPLGHLSGGTDRHGTEFLSVYAEMRPLPAPASAAAGAA